MEILKKLENIGFSYHLCSGKKPKTAWKESENQFNAEKAIRLQEENNAYIGAVIPKNILVIDLDRHKEEEDGVLTFGQLAYKYGFSPHLFKETLCFKTAGNGYHAVFSVDPTKEYKAKSKEIGIDLKPYGGYIIAVGSPGYVMESDNDILPLPEKLKEWFNITPRSKEKAAAEAKENTLNHDTFSLILKKIPATEYNNNDEWQEFVTSAIATAGDNEKTIALLEKWSQSDPEYSDDKAVRKRLKSFKKDGKITIGTFVSHMKRHGVADKLIKKVTTLNTIEAFIAEAEKSTVNLPFPIDYLSLGHSQKGRAFWDIIGHEQAATLLQDAFYTHVVYVSDEDTAGRLDSFYFFNGSRWELLYDMYSIIYTVLYLATKEHYKAFQKGREGAGGEFKALIKMISSTPYRRSVLTCLALKNGIHRQNVDWDSVDNKDTLTTKDGVIDFTTNKPVMRTGLREEYRLNFVDYTNADIKNSPEPKHYNEFFRSLFKDEDTYQTARFAVSTFISGSAGKRLFHVWHGAGFNGKSTLIDIIQAIIGPKAITYNTNLLLATKTSGGEGVTPETADFRGSLVAFGVESEDNKKISEGVVKKFTGGDRIKANPKYQKPIEFRASWQLVLATNDLPIFKTEDIAFIDRLLLIPFSLCFYKDEGHKNELISHGYQSENMVKRIEKHIIEKEILKEGPGIIRQWVKDYVSLQHDIGGIIPESDICRASKGHYIDSNDDFGQFTADCLNVDLSNRDAFISNDDLTNAFREYSGNFKATARFVTRRLIKNNPSLEASRTTRHITVDGVKKVARGLKFITLKESVNTAPEL